MTTTVAVHSTTSSPGSRSAVNNVGPNSLQMLKGSKPGQNIVSKRLTPLQMRAKAVFRAVEKLLEQGAASEEQLWAVARILSSDEFAQVAEERFLAGLCGNPLCSSPAPPNPAMQQGGRYKIDLSQRLVYEREDSPRFFCCGACEHAVRAFCVRLGSHDAAQHRFELLMRQARKKPHGAQRGSVTPELSTANALGAPTLASNPGTQHAGRAGSPQAPCSPDAGGACPKGVVLQHQGEARMRELSPEAAPASGSPPQAPFHMPTTSSSDSIASSTGSMDSSSSGGSDSGSLGSEGGRAYPKDEGGILWAPGEVPQQYMAHSRTAKKAPIPKGHKAQRAPKGVHPCTPSPTLPPVSAKDGAGSPPPPPKGVLKRKGPQYAAGTAKTPIMLAEVKERDPGVVAADTARALTPDATTVSAAHAVEGYVPRAGRLHPKRSTNQGAGSTPAGQGVSVGGLEESGSPGSVQQQRRVRFSDEVGGSLVMPSASELAAAAAAAAAAATHSAADANSLDGTELEPSPSVAPGGSSGPDEPAQPPAAPHTNALGVPGGAAAARGDGVDAHAAASQGGVGGQLAGRPGVGTAVCWGAQRPAGVAPDSEHTLLGAATPSLNPGTCAEHAAHASSSGGSPQGGAGGGWHRPLSNGVAPTSGVSASTGELVEEGSQEEAAGSQQGAPVLVFDIDDPTGPLEAAAGGDCSQEGEGAAGLASHFGRLRVVEGGGGAQEMGGGRVDVQDPQHAQQQAAPVVQMGQREEDVGMQLSRQMQAGLRRLFPRLSTTLPAELDAGLEAELASGDEGAEGSEGAESAGWSSSDEDGGVAGSLSSDEEYAGGGQGGSGFGNAAASRPRSSFRITLSFFGTLFTSLESWITDATLDHLASPPGSVPPASSSPANPPSSQVEGVLSRFLAAAVPAVMQQLSIGVPRGEVERGLQALLHTMRFSGPLPAFKSSQWQLVCIVLLKALSLERCPALRPAFESREGVGRLGRALGALGFTVEEFYALLELLCPEGE